MWSFFLLLGFKRWATVRAGFWCEDQHWAGLEAGVGLVERTKPILNVERIGHLSWYPGKGPGSIFSAAAESLQPTSLWGLGPGLWLGSSSGHPIHLPPLAIASSPPLSEAFDSGCAQIKLLSSLGGDGWEPRLRGRALPGQEEAPWGSPRGATSGAFPSASPPHAPPSALLALSSFSLCSSSSWVRSGQGKKDILSSWHLSSKQIAQRVPSVDILCTNRK